MQHAHPGKPLLWIAALSGGALALVAGAQSRSAALVLAAGVLEPMRQAELHAPENLGRVAAIEKRDGDWVAAGEVILRLDAAAAELELAQWERRIGCLEELLERSRAERAKKLDQARLAVLEALADVESEEALVEESRASEKRFSRESSGLETRMVAERLTFNEKAEEEARLTFENYRRLYDRDAVSRDAVRQQSLAYDKARSVALQARYELKLFEEATAVFQFETTRAQSANRHGKLKAAQARLQLRRAEVAEHVWALEQDPQAGPWELDLAKARMEKQRQAQLIEERTVRAPISGVLHGFHVQPGQWLLNRVDAIGAIFDTSLLRFRAHVPQRDLPKVRAGQRARIRFAAPDGLAVRVCEAEVEEVAQVVSFPGRNPLDLFTAGSAKGALLPQALVWLRILEAPGAGAPLFAGSAGHARILIGEGRLARLFF